MREDMSWNCHSIVDMPDLLTQKDGQFKIFAPDRDGKKRRRKLLQRQLFGKVINDEFIPSFAKVMYRAPGDRKR